jgi:hypothetical protein
LLGSSYRLRVDDAFELVVDVDANADDAAVLANTGLAWLADRGVVDANPLPDCVLGAGMGYRPPRFMLVHAGVDTWKQRHSWRRLRM